MSQVKEGSQVDTWFISSWTPFVSPSTRVGLESPNKPSSVGYTFGPIRGCYDPWWLDFSSPGDHESNTACRFRACWNSTSEWTSPNMLQQRGVPSGCWSIDGHHDCDCSCWLLRLIWIAAVKCFFLVNRQLINSWSLLIHLIARDPHYQLSLGLNILKHK